VGQSNNIELSGYETLCLKALLSPNIVTQYFTLLLEKGPHYPKISKKHLPCGRMYNIFTEVK